MIEMIQNKWMTLLPKKNILRRPSSPRLMFFVWWFLLDVSWQLNIVINQSKFSPILEIPDGEKRLTTTQGSDDVMNKPSIKGHQTGREDSECERPRNRLRIRLGSTVLDRTRHGGKWGSMTDAKSGLLQKNGTRWFLTLFLNGYLNAFS